MKRYIVILLLVLVSALHAQAADVYFAQNATGSGNGSSCANARALGTFNANVGPGTHVFICGSVSGLTVTASGVTGNPWTLTGGTKTSDWSFNGAHDFIIEGMTSTNGEYFFSAAHHFVFRNNMVSRCNGSAADLLRSEGLWNVTVEGNYLKQCGTNNTTHDDAFQYWNSKGAAHDITFRYNLVEIDTTAVNNKSCFMWEGQTGPSYVYGNVFLGTQGASAANCTDISPASSSAQIFLYNNTYVQKPNGFQPMMNFSSPGAYTLANNIVYSSGSSNVKIGNGVMARQNNLWFGSGIPSCTGTNDTCGVNPQFVNFAGNNFALAPGSPAIGTGVALAAQYAFGIAPGSTWPNPTIVPRASWDKGAYVSGAAPPPTPPTVTTTSLPQGTDGQAYSATLAASGGTPPYTWAVSGRPAWLGLSGATLSGTAVTGTYNLSATATDSMSLSSAPKPLTLTINPSGGGGITFTFTTTVQPPPVQPPAVQPPPVLPPPVTPPPVTPPAVTLTFQCTAPGPTGPFVCTPQ